mmetsp:Transcript_26745/g.44373  ORF Transcript_26745/g.44373 Transcript_26745/m.44373 type:complete len:100 (-) Transcript_26745:156-455(-)
MLVDFATLGSVPVDEQAEAKAQDHFQRTLRVPWLLSKLLPHAATMRLQIVFAAQQDRNFMRGLATMTICCWLVPTVFSVLYIWMSVQPYLPSDSPFKLF